MDIIGNFLIIIAVGVILFSIHGIWKSSIQIKRFSKIGRDIPKYRWLMDMGMNEHANSFNAFGITNKKL